MLTTGADAPPAAGTGGGLESGPAARSRFPCVEGLRAIAALTVLVTHVSFSANANSTPWVGPYLARMDVGVSVFFLLSGFLLYRPFVAARLGGRPRPAVLPYLRRRVLRIFPAYWLALAVVAVVLDAARVRSLVDWVVYGGLLQIYDPQRVVGGISQAWSLCTEVSFYLFLPVFAAAVARWRPRRLTPLASELVVLGALAAASFGFRMVLLATDWRHSGLALLWLPSWLDLFALGMAVAVLSVWASGRAAPPALLAAVGARPWACWAGAALAFFLVSEPLGLPVGFEAVPAWKELARHLLYAATGLLLLLPAVFGPQDRGVVRRFLRLPGMVFLGKISFGIYLWHKAMIAEVLEATGTPVFGAHLLVLLAAVTALTIAASTASWYVLERPLLSLGERGRDRRSPRFALAVPALGLGLLALFATSEVARALPPAAPPAPAAAPEPAPEPAPVAGPPPAAPVRPEPGAVTGTVLLIGDSLMYDAGPGIERALRAAGAGTVLSRTGLGTSLATPELFDWREEVEALVAEHDPAVVVAMFGGNDWQGLGSGPGALRPDDAAWRPAYRALVAEVAATATSGGADLVWLGLPRMGLAPFDAAVPSLNAVYADVVAGLGDRAAYVDLAALLAGPDGRFAPAVDGVALRKPDGVHFLDAGADRIGGATAGAVLPRLRGRSPGAG